MDFAVITAGVIRADARDLPLPDESVDLIVTSPPYFGLRSYTDGGEHYAGQIGSEATPAEWLANLLDCTREWVRVLKPDGSIFVNLGDKYAGSGPGSAKSLMGLPWRYALACMDQTRPEYRAEFLGGLLGDVLDGTTTHDRARQQLAEFDASPKSKGLGLILRAEIIWAKPNGLPESVTDRVRRSHEQVFHLTKRPKYYSAVDDIRESQAEVWRSTGRTENRGTKSVNGGANQGFGLSGVTPREYNPLGKLPGSVWDIPSQPLTVPASLGVDHFAAFPMELPRRIILGWSPADVCTVCGQGRRPVVDKALVGVWHDKPTQNSHHLGTQGQHQHNLYGVKNTFGSTSATITGYACACTPYTGHPGSGESSGPGHSELIASGRASMGTFGGPRGSAYGDRPKVGPSREYHFADWTPPPARPAVVLDPFGGTGTTALVASVNGRQGITADLSADYCRLARWRTTDPGERARAMQVPKPPPVVDGQTSLFGLEEL